MKYAHLGSVVAFKLKPAYDELLIGIITDAEERGHRYHLLTLETLDKRTFYRMEYDCSKPVCPLLLAHDAENYRRPV